MTFDRFFEALWGHVPFRWQRRLAERVLGEGWPGAVAMPTAAGKTALIDLALFALVRRADAAARRIFFVVDRRVIVDEAAERANKIAKRLAEAGRNDPAFEIAEALRALGGDAKRPLATSTLRGAVPRDDSWSESPLQPAVICSTVDQVGSAVLFRAYGASEFAWPIRAGLVAFDSLVILDEAHTAQPFAQTLERVRSYAACGIRKVARPLRVVEMSATPRTTVNVFTDSDDDRADELLNQRWTAEKRAELVIAEPREADGEFDALARCLADQARRVRDEFGARVIGVIANRVRTARAVHKLLSADDESNTLLLTGRARPWDRDQIWEKWRDRISLGGEQRDSTEAPVLVVATQCIEAGANLDFDALVTECASLDALEQRFGRLNREGRNTIARAVIAAQKNQTGSRYVDAVYGSALAATWGWLSARTVKHGTKKKRETFVPMGTSVLRQALAKTSNREDLVLRRPDAPVLMPAHMDLLCQTFPEPAISPEPAVFLHGPESGPADVQVVWRADSSENEDVWLDAVGACPPSAAEAISLPVWVVRRWLTGVEVPDISDVEGEAEPNGNVTPRKMRVLCWRGPDESEVINAIDVRPGMTIVVPAKLGGCDSWGWNPEWASPVMDIGDAVKLSMRRPVLRLGAELSEQWGYVELAERLRQADISVVDLSHVLREYVPAEGPVREIVEALSTRGMRVVPGIAIVGKAVFDQAGGRSSHTGTEVLLADHLAACKHMAARFGEAVLDPEVRTWIGRAAELHDIGKADPRFQAWLRGGNPVFSHVLLAKSAGSAQNKKAIERARRLAGYPEGNRHEVQSAAMLGTSEPDSVIHFVVSHHGRCRPFAPCVADPGPVEVCYEHWRDRSDHGLERAGSGVASRFWRLTREYGWYGLAFAEAILRLADHRQSEKERKDERSSAYA